MQMASNYYNQYEYQVKRKIQILVDALFENKTRVDCALLLYIFHYKG